MSTGAAESQRESNGSQKVAKEEPKGAKQSPKGTKRESKGAKGEPKGEPKRHPGGVLGRPGGSKGKNIKKKQPFFNHFGVHFGPFWHHVGAMLGLCCVMFGFVVVCCVALRCEKRCFEKRINPAGFTIKVEKARGAK